MPPRLLLLLLVCVIGAPHARARVGETRPQIDARYGGPGKEIGDQVLYASGDLSVSVFYTGGTATAPAKATMEIYTHRTGIDGTKPDFTPAELDGLLHDEGGDQAWSKVGKDGLTTWRRADGQLFARFQEADQAMIFLSREHRPVAGKPSMLLQDGKTAP